MQQQHRATTAGHHLAAAAQQPQGWQDDDIYILVNMPVSYIKSNILCTASALLISYVSPYVRSRILRRSIENDNTLNKFVLLILN